MAEQRLIDANHFEAYGTVIPEEYRGPGEAAFLAGATEVLERIDDAPTIDPETIPIVRQLRADLARVTAERDAVYCLPVKPGDKVYQQNGVDVYELEVKKIIFDCGHIAFDESAIGSSIHLTEEAANAALAKSVKP